MHSNHGYGYGAALLSAGLVGLFTVLNKWLLTEDLPALTAGAWTYFTAGITLLPAALGHKRLRLDRPIIFVGWLMAGSIFGPSLYFLGLKLTSGVQGTLMINLEAVFTSLIAFAFFRERLTLTTFLAGASILAGGVWLSWPTGGGGMYVGNTLGNILISLGYLGWATENNLGRLLSKDTSPTTLVCIKALTAGIVMGLISVSMGNSLTVSWRVVPGIVASGAISLACSLVLFYAAMQQIGAGRTGLISATSSLWGVIGALALLGEHLNAQTIAGASLIGVGLIGFAWESTGHNPPKDDSDALHDTVVK